MNNANHSMPEVYAVLAWRTYYYDEFELFKIFGSKESAEAYAQKLREVKTKPYFDGDEPEPEFDLVKVEAYSVN